MIACETRFARGHLLSLKTAATHLRHNVRRSLNFQQSFMQLKKDTADADG